MICLLTFLFRYGMMYIGKDDYMKKVLKVLVGEWAWLFWGFVLCGGMALFLLLEWVKSYIK